MKYDYQAANKSLARTSKFLWLSVVVLFGLVIVCILESEALVHHEPASGWYVSALDSISVALV